MRHLVWDWNGTLLDDHQLVVDALNGVLVAAGIAPVDLATYQSAYTRPLDVFYARLFGRPIAAEEWPEIDARYHATYRAGLADAGLHPEALPALRTAAAQGMSQSLLSMYPHDDLLPLVDRFDLTPHFLRVDGLRGGGGGRKAPHLTAHLDVLVASGQVQRGEVVVIGDALDDAHAAAELAVDCVLYDGGSHPRAALESLGVPVVDGLEAAVALAASG